MVTAFWLNGMRAPQNVEKIEARSEGNAYGAASSLTSHGCWKPQTVVSVGMYRWLPNRAAERQRVAAHARSARRGGFTTVDVHMPAAHRAHLEWTPARLIEWGQQIGMACGELVTRLLQTYKHPEHGYRSCLGLLSLSRSYGKERLEAACERALALGTVRYRHVRDLLANNRDLAPQEPTAEWTSPAHANVRGPDYYQ